MELTDGYGCSRPSQPGDSGHRVMVAVQFAIASGGAAAAIGEDAGSCRVAALDDRQRQVSAASTQQARAGARSQVALNALPKRAFHPAGSYSRVLAGRASRSDRSAGSVTAVDRRRVTIGRAHRNIPRPGASVQAKQKATIDALTACYAPMAGFRRLHGSVVKTKVATRINCHFMLFVQARHQALRPRSGVTNCSMSRATRQRRADRLERLKARFSSASLKSR